MEENGFCSSPRPIDSSNVGYQLLKKCGWKEGTGLGVSEQGRLEPVQTHVKKNKRGLGAEKIKQKTWNEPNNGKQTDHEHVLICSNIITKMASKRIKKGKRKNRACENQVPIWANVSLEEMMKRLKEADDEARVLHELQARAEKEEIDSRSVYVGNVDYACTAVEAGQHFQSCGAVNRVTILTDEVGQPKGFAYIEFAEAEAVQNALFLNGSELHGRPLKVSAKRTNVPGMKQYRGRPSPYGPFQSVCVPPPPYHGPPFVSHYGPYYWHSDPFYM